MLILIAFKPSGRRLLDDTNSNVAKIIKVLVVPTGWEETLAEF